MFEKIKITTYWTLHSDTFTVFVCLWLKVARLRWKFVIWIWTWNVAQLSAVGWTRSTGGARAPLRGPALLGSVVNLFLLFLRLRFESLVASNGFMNQEYGNFRQFFLKINSRLPANSSVGDQTIRFYSIIYLIRYIIFLFD